MREVIRKNTSNTKDVLNNRVLGGVRSSLVLEEGVQVVAHGLRERYHGTGRFHVRWRGSLQHGMDIPVDHGMNGVVLLLLLLYLLLYLFLHALRSTVGANVVVVVVVATTIMVAATTVVIEGMVPVIIMIMLMLMLMLMLIVEEEFVGGSGCQEGVAGERMGGHSVHGGGGGGRVERGIHEVHVRAYGVLQREPILFQTVRGVEVGPYNVVERSIQWVRVVSVTITVTVVERDDANHAIASDTNAVTKTAIAINTAVECFVQSIGHHLLGRRHRHCVGSRGRGRWTTRREAG